MITEKTSLHRVHTMFSLLNLKRAWVVNGGRLVGIVTTTELSEGEAKPSQSGKSEDFVQRSSARRGSSTWTSARAPTPRLRVKISSTAWSSPRTMKRILSTTRSTSIAPRLTLTKGLFQFQKQLETAATSNINKKPNTNNSSIATIIPERTYEPTKKQAPLNILLYSKMTNYALQKRKYQDHDFSLFLYYILFLWLSPENFPLLPRVDW